MKLSDDFSSRYVAINNETASVRIKLTGLKPNYMYSVTFQLWTPFGKGPATQEYVIETLPSDPPSLLSVKPASPNSVSFSWSKPNRVAINVTLDEVYWKLTQNDKEISVGHRVNGSYPMDVTIDNLLPAENFFFHVRAKSSKIKVNIFFVIKHFQKTI
jgi:hypothetical protein